MRKILSVKKTKRSSDCFVNFENDDSIVISMDLVLKYNLAKGRTLEDSEYDEIIREQRKIDLRQSAYKYASYKPRTEKEVRDKLMQKGFSHEEIKEALQFLEKFEFLDDAKYAENFIKEKLKLKNFGEFRMKMELIKRGIHRDLAEKSVSKYYPQDDEYEIAKAAAEKKITQILRKPEEKRWNSLSGYLQRQGFGWDVIKKICDEYLKKD